MIIYHPTGCFEEDGVYVCENPSVSNSTRLICKGRAESEFGIVGTSPHSEEIESGRFPIQLEEPNNDSRKEKGEERKQGVALWLVVLCPERRVLHGGEVNNIGKQACPRLDTVQSYPFLQHSTLIPMSYVGSFLVFLNEGRILSLE